MENVELIIKIPEKLYKAIKKHADIYEEEVEDVALSIIGSTLLPKGHGRLIDADDLLEKHPEFDTYPFPSTTIDNALPIIEADKESEDRYEISRC